MSLLLRRGVYGGTRIPGGAGAAVFYAGPAAGVTNWDQEGTYWVDYPPGYAYYEIGDYYGERCYRLHGNCSNPPDYKAGLRLKWAPDKYLGDPEVPMEWVGEAWYYIPTAIYHPGSWFWNVWQMEKSTWNGSSQSATPIIVVNFTQYPLSNTSGNLYILLEKVGGGSLGVGSTPLPIGSWFKVSVEYKWAMTATGYVRVYLNDVLQASGTNVITDVDTGYPDPPPVSNRGPYEINWNHYTANTSPLQHYLAVRDMKIWNA